MAIPRRFDPSSPRVEQFRAGAVEATTPASDPARGISVDGREGAPASARSLQLVPAAVVLLSVAEVAAMSRRHPETVRLALQRGLLVGGHSGAGGVWSIKRGDALRWIDAGSPWQRLPKR